MTSVCLSLSLSVRLFVCLTAHLSVCPSLCLSSCLSYPLGVQVLYGLGEGTEDVGGVLLPEVWHGEDFIQQLISP